MRILFFIGILCSGQVGLQAQVSKVFAEQMEVITQDFPKGFASLMGRIIAEDEEEFTFTMYASNVTLEGATDLSIDKDEIEETVLFHAGYPGSFDPLVALQSYQMLVAAIESLKLACCPLTKDEEYILGNIHFQAFHVYDPAGNLSPDHRGMVIEVRIGKGKEFDANKELVDYWVPLIEVHKE